MERIHSNSTVKESSEIGAKLIAQKNNTPIAEDAYFEITYQKLSEKSSELTESINRGNTQSDLKAKDELRDLDIRAIFYTVEAHCMRRKSEKQEKAMKIMQVLNRYGMNITKYSYTNESASIRSVLLDLKAPELADARSAITDLDALIENLENSQAAFYQSQDNLSNLELERTASKPAYVLAQELRDIVNNDLCGYLESMAKANPEKYMDFATKFAKIIADANKEVRDRIAAAQRKKEESEVE